VETLNGSQYQMKVEQKSETEVGIGQEACLDET
jgi:hypothetical protein